jgi:hypothetical protein
MSGRGAARGSERSAESGRVIHSRCLQRARERRAGRCRRISSTGASRPGRQMVRSTSRPSPIPFYALRIGATMELGWSRRPTMTHDDDVGFAWSAASAASYGVIDQRQPNSAALTWGAWPRSFYDVWSGCMRGSERSAESGRVIHSRCLQRARVRRAGRCRRRLNNKRKQGGC